MTALHLGKSIGRSLSWRCGFLLIPLALACFALSPTARALLPPPAPDGNYPSNNTAEGQNALFSLNFGNGNTAIGSQALTSNTDGNYNTATGVWALQDNTTGGFNTATGTEALGRNTTGISNTAIGYAALVFNTTGSENTANGVDALESNITGNDNVATGVAALLDNTTGSQNTATGVNALLSNTTASNNTADGVNALYSNTTGTQNTATGVGALRHNNTASNNTADGFQALFDNITGGGNTAIGFRALLNNKGSSNIALGLSAGVNLTIGSNNIDIGSAGVGGESNTIRIGSAQVRTFIKGISGAVVSGAAVVVNAGGQLGVAASSERFKTEIKPMDKASEAILALKPVTFRYKKEIDPAGAPQLGLVAEDVEKVNPDLIVRDKEGKPYSVRYDQVNAMVLNEFLKEYSKVEKLEAYVATQEATILQQKKDFQAIASQQQKQIEALTTGLHKVSAKLEASKPAPQVVNNP